MNHLLGCLTGVGGCVVTMLLLYALGGIGTVLFFHAMISESMDWDFALGLFLTWPLFWLMALIFILPAA